MESALAAASDMPPPVGSSPDAPSVSPDMPAIIVGASSPDAPAIIVGAASPDVPAIVGASSPDVPAIVGASSPDAPSAVTAVADKPKAKVETDDDDEEEEDDDDDESEAEDADEEDDDDDKDDDEAEYIFLSRAEFNAKLPSLFNTVVNPNSKRDHPRRQKTADHLFPHLANRLYRCQEYPHGIFINEYGELCPNDSRSGLYQVADGMKDAEDEADAQEAAEDAAEEEGDDDEEEGDADAEDCDNDNTADPADSKWVSIENKLRTKSGMKRKTVTPDDDDDENEDYVDEEDGDGTDSDDDDDDAEEGDAEMADDDAEFDEDDQVVSDEDADDYQPKKKKTKRIVEDGDEDDEDEEEEEDDEEGDEVDEADEDDKKPKQPLTPEEKKSAFLKSLSDAASDQDRINQLAEDRRRQRVQQKKNITVLEGLTEDWKKLRSQAYRRLKSAESNPERRKLIKNLEPNMTFDSYLMKSEPGCDFVFRKPVPKRRKRKDGDDAAVAPEPVDLVPMDPIRASFDCKSNEVVCQCQKRFTNATALYDHVCNHFTEARIRRTLEVTAATPALTAQ